MINVSQLVSGHYKWRVLNKLGVIINSSDHYKNNLILDQGLNYVPDYIWSDCFAYCAIGSDNTAVAVDQVGLVSETRRTGTVCLEEGQNGSSYAAGVLSMKRSFLFTSVGYSYEVNEIGWSPLGAAGNNLFSRVVLDSPVGVPSGHELIIEYELRVSVSPITNQAVSGEIENLPISGFAKIQYIGLSSVNEFGESVAFDDGYMSLEPSFSAAGFLSSTSGALADVGSSVDRSAGLLSNKSASFGPYGSGDYFRNKSCFFGVTPSALNDIYSFGIGSVSNSASGNAFTVSLSSPFSKPKNNELRIFYVISWGRS